jgi:DegV family protein with EDD domain
MIQIITDSASDITLRQAQELNVHIVPVHIQFPDGPCPQETDEDLAAFYDRLIRAEELPTTSQPTPNEYLRLFEAAESAGDDVLVLTLSGGLSGTVGAARIAADLSGYERIRVVDTRLAISAQRILTEYAVKLRDGGMAIDDMVTELEAFLPRITVYGVIDTLTYLRKGGRIPASLSVLGNALRIKPVIILEDGILKTIGKGLGHGGGKKLLWQRFEENTPDPAFPMYFIYTSDREMGRKFMEETVEKYGLQDFRTELIPIGGVIGTHLGTCGVGVSYVTKEAD